MKRSLLIAGLLGTATIAFGQQFSAGPMMGANFSYITVEQSINTSGKYYQIESNTPGLGIMAGVFAEISWERLFIQPQLTFSQDNTSLRFDTEFGQVTQKMSVHRFQIPVVVGYKLGSLVSVYAGPMLNTFIDGSLVPTNQDMFARHMGNVQRVVLGYQVGAGLNFNRSTFALQYRDNFQRQGFDTAYKNSMLRLAEHSHVLQFSFSYRVSFRNQQTPQQEREDIFFPPKEITVSE